MSYCVHCGVELEKSETKWSALRNCSIGSLRACAQPEKMCPRPYPKRVEQLNARINRQFASVFVSVFMFFAALICLIINFLTENGLSWSQYVVSSVFLAWVVVTGPLLFRKGIILKSIICDTAALLLFLYMIQQTDGTAAWYYAVGGADHRSRRRVCHADRSGRSRQAPQRTGAGCFHCSCRRY